LIIKSKKNNKLGKGVWITIPTMNEAGNIQPLMKDIESVMNGFTYHVCVASGIKPRKNSTDKKKAKKQNSIF